jgi:hypothetical protein
MEPDEIEGLAYNTTKINQEQHEHGDDQEEDNLKDHSDDNDDNAEPRNEGEEMMIILMNMLIFMKMMNQILK